MVTDGESKFTIREPRAMGVGVPFKMMSNGTSGTVGKIWLRIVKVSLPSVNQGKKKSAPNSINIVKDGVTLSGKDLAQLLCERFSCK
jgi:hypothetical protein